MDCKGRHGRNPFLLIVANPRNRTRIKHNRTWGRHAAGLVQHNDQRKARIIGDTGQQSHGRVVDAPASVQKPARGHAGKRLWHRARHDRSGSLNAFERAQQWLTGKTMRCAFDRGANAAAIDPNGSRSRATHDRTAIGRQTRGDVFWEIAHAERSTPSCMAVDGREDFRSIRRRS